MDLQNFLEERQEALTTKFEAGNVDEILKHYDEKEVNFSDHAWQATNLNRDQFIAFLNNTYSTVPGFQMITHGVHGTKEFSTWEWTLKFVAKEDDLTRGLEKGKEIWLRGVSLHWWNLRDGGDGDQIWDWRIYREADYACVVQVEKGESEKLAETHGM